MNKKYIKILIIAIVIILLISVAAYLFLSMRDGDSSRAPDKVYVNIMSEEEKAALNLYHLGVYEIISRDANNNIDRYRFIRLEEAEPIDLELMTNEEKQNFGISTDLKIQVLKRDAEGKITSYHIIKNDSDIVKKY